MAYREVGMWEILEVLRRVHRGEPYAAIQRATGHTRKTVRRYVRLARGAGWDATAAVPDEALAATVGQRLKPARKTPTAGEAAARLAPHREQIRQWLAPEPDGSRGLRLTKVHTLLSRQGVSIPYSSLHRFAVRHCGFQDTRRLTVRMADTAPGELAEIDFGRLGLVPDPESGRLRVAHALVVTLVHSRHQYVHITRSQRLPDVIEGLEDAWTFFGGVVARVVLDNLKAAITKADRYDPVFQRVFAEYAQHRGFVIDAALPRHPTGKPHVERGIQYVRESFFRGETWLDLAHVQREVVRWCREVAGLRVHGTTQQRPLVVFEAIERPTLQPLTAARFDPPTWKRCKAHPDHHIEFDRALYSVPTAVVGQRLWVRGDRGLVRIYEDGVLLKTHPRQPPGGRHTDVTDYPAHLAPYALRDPERMTRDAHAQGPAVGAFVERLLAGPLPWARLRQVQKLLRLGHRYGRSRVDAACQRALAFDLLNVHRVERIVQHDLARLPTRPSVPAPDASGALRFLRPRHSFTHPADRKES
jgi:transposase